MPHMKVVCSVSRFAFVRLAWFVLLLGLSAPLSMAQSSPINSITIREKAGVATNNYPIQIGRVFKQGEISNFPNAVVNGTSVKTQADIKSRWPDQSVKHAILSFYIPTLKANGSATVTFTNQTAVLKGKTVEATTSVTSNGNRPVSFNATMELTSATGQKISASVRDMISANKYTYWTQGPISSSVIVADHSEARAYDIGFDPNRSFRPIFHVTFWPAINKIKVRYIGEIANTLALQDMNYSLVLKLQDGTFKTVYSRPSFRHVAAGRWTKEFWSGGEPAKIEINHNLAYLRQTLAIPNFDTSFVLSEATLQGAYENPDDGWMNAQKEIFERGNLFKAMPTAGGRDEIGPYPTWVTRWLYSGDWRMYAQSKGNAELSAAFPVHFREGLGNRNFDRTGPNALGRVLSISARPTVFLHRGNAYIDYFYTEPADKIVPVGSMSKDDEWLPDCAHQPDYHSALYTLTGDYFYLEEMNFWASWSAVSANFTNVFWYGRGPTGDTGGIIDEVRGDGWIMRGRAQAAFLNPDGSPEKAYFTRLISDAVAIWEGTLGITGTANENTASWIWGRDVARKKFYDYNHVPHQHAVPPLGFWEEGHAVQSWDENVDFTKASIETSPWMHYILVYGLGRAKELGYPTDKVLIYAAKLVNESLTDANYNPYLACSYQMPTVRKSDDDFYSNWADVKNAFLPSFNPMLPFNEQLRDGNHGYALLLQTAASMTKSEPNGAAAWSFVQQNILPVATGFNTNPKWAILPRQ